MTKQSDKINGLELKHVCCQSQSGNVFVWPFASEWTALADMNRTFIAVLTNSPTSSKKFLLFHFSQTQLRNSCWKWLQWSLLVGEEALPAPTHWHTDYPWPSKCHLQWWTVRGCPKEVVWLCTTHVMKWGTHWTGPIWSKINLASVSSLSLKPAQSPLMTSITSSLTLPVDYLQLLFYFFPLIAAGIFSGPAAFPCSPSQQVIRNAAFFSSRFIFASST